MIRIFLLALSIVLATAGASAAQEGAPPVEQAAPAPTAPEAPSQPTADQRQARAAEIITSAGAEGLFVADDQGAAIAVRHVRSGMRCLFAYGAGGSIIVVPASPLNIPRGDDVACTSETGLGLSTVYATRYPAPSSMDQALANAVSAIRVRFARVQEVPMSALQTLTLPGTATPPESRSAAFMVRDGERDLFTRVSVFVAGGWEYKMRFTSETPRANIMADMLWITTLNDLTEHAAAQQAVVP